MPVNFDFTYLLLGLAMSRSVLGDDDSLPESLLQDTVYDIPDIQ